MYINPVNWKLKREIFEKFLTKENNRKFVDLSDKISCYTAGNWHKQNNRFCKEICEDNFRFWWRRVPEDASQGMYMSKIEIFFFTARIL